MAKTAMSMDRMKAIDLWLGLPLCACFGGLARLYALFAGRQPVVPHNPRRIIVMKFFGLGSVVQAGPMLRAIRQRYPKAKLTFLAFEGTAGLVERMGVCDEVWQLRANGMLPFAADVMRQILRFMRDRADICIDLEFFSKFSTLMSVLSGAPVRVAFHLNSFWRSSVVTHPVYYNYYRHVSEVYNDAAATVGAPVEDMRPCRISVEPEAVERCRQLLRAAGWNGIDHLVGVNVNAGELSLERRWPGDRFAAVLDRLAATDGVCPVLTGAPQETNYVAEVFDLLGDSARARVINLAGKLSFAEFIASMDLYDFFLTNDSGPLHIAYAQGLDTISLWGVGRPSFYGPLIGRHSTFYKHFPCSPCLYMFTSEIGQWCRHRADCMRAIEVDEVWNAVKTYLETRRGGREKTAAAQG